MLENRGLHGAATSQKQFSCVAGSMPFGGQCAALDISFLSPFAPVH